MRVEDLEVGDLVMLAGSPSGAPACVAAVELRTETHGVPAEVEDAYIKGCFPKPLDPPRVYIKMWHPDMPGTYRMTRPVGHELAGVTRGEGAAS